jgi:hypothetical protein
VLCFCVQVTIFLCDFVLQKRFQTSFVTICQFPQFYGYDFIDVG